jgi:hypothetical protein
MKRTLHLLTVAALSASLAGTSVAATKKPAAPKPSASTFYLHGANTIGEQDQTIVTGGPLAMDRTKPSGSTDKGKVLTNYVLGPNTDCTANGAFAVWVGEVAGTLSGKINVTFFTQNDPHATVDVRVFVDADSNLCNSTTGGNQYPGALAEANGVALPAAGGKTSLSLPVIAKGKNAIAHGTLVLEIIPGGTAGLVGPEFARVLYDSTTAMSSVTFTCLPKAGKKTC